MAAAQRLLNSLTDEQRDELAGLMAQAMADAGLAQEMARLADALRERRPDIDWDGQGSERMTGRDPLGLGDATTALAELADLAELEDSLRQDCGRPAGRHRRGSGAARSAGRPSTTWRRCARSSASCSGRAI
jgi:uncharacterized protein with von Willebrand factor type A (vWA) domain